MKKNLLPLVFIALSVVLAATSFLLLPDTVITQLSTGGSGVSTMPKPLAVLLPTALGIGGAIWQRSEADGRSKGLIVSCVGILVFIIMLAVNL